MIDQGGDLSTIPAKLMLQIDTPGRQALHNYVLAHGNPATDPVTYYGLKNQALDDHAGFQSIDLSNHIARLKPADYTELQQLQTSLNNNQPPADLPLLQAYKANTDQLLQRLRLPTGNAPISDTDASAGRQGAQQAAQLRQAVDQHVTATEIATGRKMTPADHQNLLSQMAEQPISAGSSDSPKRDSALAGTIGNSVSLEAAPVEQLSLGEITAVAKALLGRMGTQGLELLSEAAIPAVATVGAVAAGSVAGMWPKSTGTDDVLYGPQADQPPSVSTPTASPDLDEFQGPQSNESSKKDYKRKRDAAEAASKAKATSGAATPPPDQQEPDKNKKQPAFKRPNDDLEFGDQIDLKRFTKRVILDENPKLKTLEDPDSGYRIQKDTGGHGRLAPKEWKLRDRLGRRVGSLDGNGRYLGK